VSFFAISFRQVSWADWAISWIFTLFWVIGGALEAFSTQSCMLLWMQASNHFTVPQNNDYPLGITAIGIVVTLVTSMAIDASQVHFPWGLLACTAQLIACIILLCWNHINDGAKMAAYCRFPTTSVVAEC
jgi:ACS family pantothenate transporter-like MFS transporter